VAAETEEIAKEALDLIDLNIDSETPVFDPLEAMKPEAPKVRPEGNILMIANRPYRLVYNGDVEKGFAEADEIVEEEYFFCSQKHVAMETQVSLAVPEADSRLSIYTVSPRVVFSPKTATVDTGSR